MSSDVIDPLLWREAQLMLGRHAEPGFDHRCVWCGFRWPCPARRLAERAAAAARRPARPRANGREQPPVSGAPDPRADGWDDRPGQWQDRPGQRHDRTAGGWNDPPSETPRAHTQPNGWHLPDPRGWHGPHSEGWHGPPAATGGYHEPDPNGSQGTTVPAAQATEQGNLVAHG